MLSLQASRDMKSIAAGPLSMLLYADVLRRFSETLQKCGVNNFSVVLCQRCREIWRESW